MGTEIERKFLLSGSKWTSLITETIYIRQGYLSAEKERTVRVRIWGKQGKLTIKSNSINGVCDEYEYDIPLQDAQEMLDRLCYSSQIEKKRHLVPFENHLWEIDEFLGENNGLIVAEIELLDRDEQFVFPTWIAEEVTKDHRYKNSQLCFHPYLTWGPNFSKQH